MNVQAMERTFQQKNKISKKAFCSVIIVAAGRGIRMESKINKVYMEILGKQAIVRVLEKFQENFLVDEIILVVNEKDKEYCEENITDIKCFSKIKEVVVGGKKRQDSVNNGLNKASRQAEVILVHDGARPLVTHEIIERSVEGALEYGAVTVAVPAKDTIKIADKDGFVCETPERKTLWAVQTPQAFKKELLLEAYREAERTCFEATDDAMLVERLGHKIKLIEGSYENIKITTPEDIAIAEAILKWQENS